jgi:hypothetical protein
MNPLACPECGHYPLTEKDEDKLVGVLLATGIVSIIDILTVENARRRAAFAASGATIEEFVNAGG